MDNNNFPQNNGQNDQPQQPFTPDNQPVQQPLEADQQPEQPQQPFALDNQPVQQPFEADQQPFDANQQQQPFGQDNMPPYNSEPLPSYDPFAQGNPPYAENSNHNFNTQSDNPFMSAPQNSQNAYNHSAHVKGIISTICGAVSILFTIIALIAVCTCTCNFVGNVASLNYTSASNSLGTALVVGAILASLAFIAAIVGIVFAALGKKTSKDSLLTAGLVLSIIGAVLTFIFLFACICTCACGSGTYSAYSSEMSDLESVFNGLYNNYN